MYNELMTVCRTQTKPRSDVGGRGEMAGDIVPQRRPWRWSAGSICCNRIAYYMWKQNETLQRMVASRVCRR